MTIPGNSEQNRPRRIFVGTTCNNGHLITESNLKIDGHGKRRCHDCIKAAGRRAYHLRRQEDPEGEANRRRGKEQRRRERNRERERELSRGHKPDPDAPRLFDIALDEVKPKCDGDSRFTDWETPSENSDPEYPAPPSAKEARSMCDGCPLIDLCMQASLVKRPFHGIYAGQRFENGRRLQ